MRFDYALVPHHFSQKAPRTFFAIAQTVTVAFLRLRYSHTIHTINSVHHTLLLFQRSLVITSATNSYYITMTTNPENAKAPTEANATMVTNPGDTKTTAEALEPFNEKQDNAKDPVVDSMVPPNEKHRDDTKTPVADMEAPKKEKQDGANLQVSPAPAPNPDDHFLMEELEHKKLFSMEELTGLLGQINKPLEDLRGQIKSIRDELKGGLEYFREEIKRGLAQVNEESEQVKASKDSNALLLKAMKLVEVELTDMHNSWLEQHQQIANQQKQMGELAKKQEDLERTVLNLGDCSTRQDTELAREREEKRNFEAYCDRGARACWVEMIKKRPKATQSMKHDTKVKREMDYDI